MYDPVLNKDWEGDLWTVYGPHEDNLANGFCIAFWTDSADNEPDGNFYM
jgi:hypothetical protein